MLGTLWVVQSRTSAPADWSADAGFARDMQTHHAQAVEMAFLVRDRSDDEELRTVAYDIITSQQQQAGQMYGWLVQWGLPQTGSRPPMAWVGGEHAEAHASADGTMPGMATEAQLDELRAATGVEAERIFLRLMIAHHEGGVAMADAAVADAQDPRGADPRPGHLVGADLGDRAPAADARRPHLRPRGWSSGHDRRRPSPWMPPAP